MIGLAGCGCMGTPMLEALRHVASNATGFDIAQKDQDWITSDFLTFGHTLETLFIVVNEPEQILDLLFRNQKLVYHASHLRRVVLCTTVSLEFIRHLRRLLPAHISLMDAPPSGDPDAAKDRRLAFTLGGEDEDIDDLIPLLASMGTAFYHMGPLGTGMQAKLLNAILAASNAAMTRLVLDWADAQGLDPEALLQIVSESTGQNWFATNFEQIAYARDGHSPTNPVGNLVREMAYAIENAPASSDILLPQSVMNALRNLKARIE